MVRPLRISFAVSVIFVGAVSANAAEPPTADWWSLKPIVRPVPPKLDEKEARWARTPIDAFILAKLREKGLSPSPEADKRILIRRLTFDLIGLPASPDEVDAFVKDTSPDAYAKVVERLLSSPHYGERWARHWLDVVHYGDSHGYDKDKPRPNAWPYRDYVIRAFNEDRPYARFVQEQVAGDVLFPGTADGIEALGFISAGPWDFIGHAEVPESKIDGKIARHLDRDDMISNTMMTFVSTTVQCAQCHNHKFDPITQEDYYSLQAVFAALDRADRKYYRDPAIAKRAGDLEAKRKTLLETKQQIDARLAKALPELGAIDRRIAMLRNQPSQGRERPEFGYHSGISPVQETTKWVQVDLGKPAAIDAIELVGCHDDFNNIGAGFGFPVRFKVELSDDPTFRKGVTLLLDRTSADMPNPGVEPQREKVGGKAGRYLRITATKLAPRQNDFILALGELSVFGPDNTNLAAGAAVTALDSIEAPPRWRKSNLVDGYYFGRKNQPAKAELGKLEQKRQGLVEKIDPALRKEAEQNAVAVSEIDREISRLPSPSYAYVGAVYTSGSAFSGTGPFGGKPRTIHLLKRGDVRQPLQEVGPGAISSIKELSARFELPPNHLEGERRAALARWLTDPRNPLTWRSIVNRIWRYHMGRGMVESPNDFGKMGQLPTHPELLDWLAVEFRDGGQSIKKLHKLIVMSSTYRQSSRADSAAQKIDAENAWLSRMNRKRLEAEAIRDSVLAVSGKLDPKMYGPAFQDFVVEKPEHSPHYEYHLHDPEDPRAHRRSIYRFLVRSQQQPFMTTLDCADPSMQVDKRNETLSPLQALALLNNGLMLAMSKHFAQRVEKQEKGIEAQVVLAHRLALAREPSADEKQALVEFAQKHGMANTCRLILNLNEFVFVD